jgi:hypothetical protein
VPQLELARIVKVPPLPPPPVLEAELEPPLLPDVDDEPPPQPAAMTVSARTPIRMLRRDDIRILPSGGTRHDVHTVTTSRP